MTKMFESNLKPFRNPNLVELNHLDRIQAANLVKDFRLENKNVAACALEAILDMSVDYNYVRHHGADDYQTMYKHLQWVAEQRVSLNCIFE